MAEVDVTDQGPSPRRSLTARAIGRRYYPFLIGAAFLVIVVDLFPSTTPTGLLGVIPKLPTAPARVAQATPNVHGPTISAPAPFSSGAPPAAAPQPFEAAASSVAATTPGVGVGGTGASGPTVSCSLPVPMEPPSPPAANLIELFSAAGPFGPEAIAGAGLIAPVVPVVTPLLPLASNFAGGANGAALSNLLTEIADLEDQVFGPFQQEIQAGTPEFVAGDETLVRDLGPVISLAEEIPDLSCVGEVETAIGATVDPSAYPGASALTAAPNGTAKDRGVVSLSANWASGVTPSLVKTANAWIADGDPVDVHLVDVAPATPEPGSTFASWVASAIAALPQVTAFEIDEPASATTLLSSLLANPATNLADALTAAAENRAPGQLLGIGLPVPLGAAPWWSSLSSALPSQVRNAINFLGLDTSSLAGVTPSDLHWIIAELRAGIIAESGIPSSIPLFVTVGPSSSATAGQESELAAQYGAALASLGVGLLLWDSPSTESGAALPDSAQGQSLLASLATDRRS